MQSGIIKSINLRSKRDSEPLKKAVKKVNGISMIRIERNLFSGTLSSFLYLDTKTRNRSKEIEKKNILCTTSISNTIIEYVTGAKKVIPNNKCIPIKVFVFAIKCRLLQKINESTLYIFSSTI